MTNIRGSRVTILKNNTYRMELIIMLLIGVLVGSGSLKLYYMIDTIYVAEPLKSLCKGGQLYKQTDPRSGVYIKQDKECENA